METILVTGGAGFIGSHLCDYLLRDGQNTVVVIDNFSLGTKENIQHLLANPKFILYNQDILNAEQTELMFQKHNFDFVYHLAANSDIAKSFTKPSTDYNNTFGTTYTVLECMRKYNVKKLFFASTSAIYGEAENAIAEDFGPLFPVSHYGAGKLASEAFISSYSSSYQIQTWITRFPNVVGNRTTHGIIYDFLKKIEADKENLLVLGDGEQEKPYLHVLDLIGAIMYVIANTNERLNYYNVAGKDRMKVKNIATALLEEAGQTRNILFTGGKIGWVGDVPKFAYDTNKIEQLGWKPSLNSEQAIRRTVSDIIKEKAEK